MWDVRNDEPIRYLSSTLDTFSSMQRARTLSQGLVLFDGKSLFSEVALFSPAEDRWVWEVHGELLFFDESRSLAIIAQWRRGLLFMDLDTGRERFMIAGENCQPDHYLADPSMRFAFAYRRRKVSEGGILFHLSTGEVIRLIPLSVDPLLLCDGGRFLYARDETRLILIDLEAAAQSSTLATFDLQWFGDHAEKASSWGDCGISLNGCPLVAEGLPARDACAAEDVLRT